VRQTVLSPALARWIDNADGKPIWQRWEWRDKLPLTATFGVIDNPFAAEQMPLAINAAEPLLVFGASGRGKTTFLKSLLFTLAAERSPSELNIYALDFGRGGLKTLGALPHCGATIDAARADRIEALFRMLKGIINERQERLAKFPSIEDYNAQHKDNPEALFPAIIFVIDNFAEFKENFEYLLPELMSMVRDGRQFGISFVITASVLNDIGNKLANLFTQKLCFTVSGGDYSDIVGKPPLPLTDLPGRGYAPVTIENRAVPLEFHVATPVIEGERDPYMRIAERMGAASDAAGIKRPSAEIPKSVTLLEMIQAMKLKKTERIGDIGIADNWRASMLPENQDWLRADIGFVSSKELRSLYFTAKAGGDGVHGLAAGTTGSGKSELIQTLITSMALRYDPRIVNFVLIDYKGGPTVEPFRQLPHAVDIATNLDGNAVDRIFVAIGAEMNRRSAILAKAGVADLVEYRKKVIPTLKPDSPLPRTFPHLFVIVDEFAEMITNNPDYKAKFDSITRLGRSFGVSLILATQKPSGVVTDQMKANMKFRLCLRVETADDSKELLNRPDAATLPSLGGRGYLQVGGGPLTEVQAAWSGAPYDETRPDPAYPAPDILKAMGKDDDPPRALLGWVVGAMQLEAQRQNIGRQFKPWPDLLPPVIQLHGTFDASYIPALRDKGQKQVVINEHISAWVAAADAGQAPGWTAHDYARKMLLKASVGIVDNTYEAEQQLFEVDLTADPLLIMGASGRGKSTFIKSLVLALCAKYSPSELHVYGLDLARGGLKALRNLPHVGGIVDGNDEDRVERLFRMAFNLINERQRKLAAFDDFDDYNAKNPQNPLPSVLIVIDNVAEFRETYDKYLGDLIALLRDGRSFGLYFAVAGALVADVPGKVFSLIPQRISFYQSDPSTYQDILGKRGGNIPDVNGRGLLLGDVGGQPYPLEFHAAIAQDDNGADLTRELGNRMRAAWDARVQDQPALRSRGPKSVEPLATQIDIGELLAKADSGALPPAIAIGINDSDREPTQFETSKSAHLLLIGPPMSGKTTTMRSIMLALAHAYPPDRLGIVVADPSDSARRFFNYGAANGANLSQLPHVLAQVTNGREIDDLILHLMAEYDEMTQIKLRQETELTYAAIDNTKRAIVVLLDHADDMEALNKGSKFGGITTLAEIGKGKNLHFVMAGSLEIMRAGSTELRKRVESARQALVLQDIDTVRFMGPRGPFTNKEMPAGRGYLVRGLTATLTQVAMPALDGRDGRDSDDVLGERIQAIVRRHADNMARWSYFAKDLAPLADLIYGQKPKDVAAGASVNGQAATYDSSYSADQADATQEMLDMDALFGTMEVVVPTDLNMAKWEIPEGTVADEDLKQKAEGAANQQPGAGGAA
jgi:DNA segregation ATPase FtsK/SpoIIIE-like protein